MHFKLRERRLCIYDRNYLQLSWRTARTKKKETLKLYASGSGWCIIEHIGCVKAVKPSIADHQKLIFCDLYSSASWFEFTQLL
ncbi:unnamed protein product [Musa acuminata subsp. burmannicoides]